MSTNSATQFTVGDDGSLSETPIQAIKKCTRGSPCSRPDCLTCNGPVTNNHLRDLTNYLEGSNEISRTTTLTKITTPLDHWITTLTSAFKEAILDQDIKEMRGLNQSFSKVTGESLDHLKYNRTEFKKLSFTAMQIVNAYYQDPTPSLPPPPLLILQVA